LLVARSASSDKRVLQGIMNLSIKAERQPSLAVARKELASSGARMASRVLRSCIVANDPDQFAAVLAAAAGAVADFLLPPVLLRHIAQMSQDAGWKAMNSTTKGSASLASVLARSKHMRVRAAASILLCDSIRYFVLQEASDAAKNAAAVL